jgi:chaperonin GroEL (HSP60 family)
MLSKLVVEAVKTVAEDGRVDTDNIRMTKKIGGVIGDTTLMKGLIIDKELVHSRMPAQVKNAKIALFNCGLEVKKTEIDAQIQINDAARMNDFLAEEEAGMKKLVDHIKSCGATVVFTTKAMDELIQHYLTKAGIMGFRRLKESDIMALAKATGGTVVSDVKDLVPENLGTAGLVEEKKVGDDNMCFVTECPNAKAVTMFIRGGTEHVIEEVERALNDAIRTVGITLEDGKVCAGAGAPEIELETRLLKYAATVGGREQLAIEKFAKAMECIPWTLAENAGLDPIDVIIKLKAAHENKKNGKYFGVSLDDGQPFDALKAKVIEPLRVKKQAVSSAAGVANMILRIDDVIAARQAPPGAGAGPGAGMPPMDD